MDISIIIPVLNEAKCINEFIERTEPVVLGLNIEFEFIFVDDGSTDSTVAILEELHKTKSFIKIIKFSRNFGKEAALTAGLEFSTGQTIIPIDADLQDPPSIIQDLYLEYVKTKKDVILAIRNDRSTDSYFKKLSAKYFYKFFNQLSKTQIYENAGDCRLMSRKIVNEILKLKEKTRFMKGLFSWPGFSSSKIYYKREERIAGHSKFNFFKLWNFALDGILSYSDLPLRIWTYIGFVFSGASFTYMFFMYFRTLFFGNDVPGYASLICLISFIGGLILMSIGIIGEYLARIFIEIKDRPLYVVESTLGLKNLPKD